MNYSTLLLYPMTGVNVGSDIKTLLIALSFEKATRDSRCRAGHPNNEVTLNMKQTILQHISTNSNSKAQFHHK
jgi:hypothetical protein